MSGLLVAAFFDGPGLLGVRLAADAQASRVERFADSRRPDVGCSGTVVALTAVGAVLAIGTVLAMRGCGGTDEPRLPRIESAVPESAAGPGWRAGLATLADDLAPTQGRLEPYAVRTLLDVPAELARRGDPSGGWLRPRLAGEDIDANRRARNLGELIAAAQPGPELALILDLPGPQSVAAAAGLADRFEPVFTMDNLPHPDGVVPSDETLAAVIQWRPELLIARRIRPAGGPAVFVLEGLRLTPYANEVDRFDNRSLARLPDLAGWQRLGVQRIIYVRPAAGQVAENADLSALFVALAGAGIEVRHLGLDSVPLPGPEKPEPTRTGNMGHLLWRSYGWYGQPGILPTPSHDPDAEYRARPRPVAVPMHLDGGAARHNETITRLSPPPRPPPAVRSGGTGSSGGGSWFRSFSSGGSHSS